MSGVMAGSAILAAKVRRNTLGTITLTLNNTCNLACPHCYLQYDGPQDAIHPTVIDHVLACDFERICIVGKEPLADTRSVDSVCCIVEAASKTSRTVSLVTNGLNGHLLHDEILEKLAWVDVSLDGGQATYGTYRRGSWEKLRESLASMRDRGLKDLRVLQTLSAATLDSIPDMVETGFGLGASLIVFSPFQPTRAQGRQTAIPILPEVIVRALEPFAADRRLYLSLDSGYTSRFKDVQRAIELAGTLFDERFTYVDTDPIDRGIIRVTYDGLVLTPFEAVNTDDYRSVGRPVMARPLEVWFDELLRMSQFVMVH